MRVGLLTDRINNKLERSNLINEHALNREPVPLIRTLSMPPSVSVLTGFDYIYWRATRVDMISLSFPLGISRHFPRNEKVENLHPIFETPLRW